MIINGQHYQAPAIGSTWRTKYSSKSLEPGRVWAISNVYAGRCKAGREPQVIYRIGEGWYTVPLRLWYEKMEMA